jgi:hypothetical protein
MPYLRRMSSDHVGSLTSSRAPRQFLAPLPSDLEVEAAEPEERRLATAWATMEEEEEEAARPRP